jgi:hypothetical protein
MSDASFTAVADLIALISDPKACAKRMAELQTLGAEIAAAQAKLDAARAEHDRKITADTAELAEREAAVGQRHVVVSIAEREVAAARARDAAAMPPRYPSDPNFAPGTISHSGLARDHYRE